MKPWGTTVEGLTALDAISLAVADEIASRYATNKIYTTRAVAQAYPHLERALLREGSDADLGGLVADAWAEGYEFGGERTKRPLKRRGARPRPRGATAEKLPTCPNTMHYQL